MSDYVVDYETYFSKKDGISVSGQGVPNYVDSTYAYMISVVGDGVKWVGSIEEAQQRFPDSFWNDPRNQFWAANSNFDEAFTRKIWSGATAMRPWKCVIDLGAASQYGGSLALLAKGLFGDKVDKSLRDWMDGRHYNQLDAATRKQLLDYCLSDSVKEHQILRRLPAASAIEEKIAAHTRMTNRRGIMVDMERLERDDALLQAAAEEAHRKLPWAGVDKPLSAAALARWAGSKGIPVPESLAKDDEECAELMAGHPVLDEIIGYMRAYRKANTLRKKLEALLDRVTTQDILPLELIYCGARHTRRWSCRGFNVQNLDREPYQFSLGGEQKSVWTREWLAPRPGKIFLILDFAQIEPRCLNWLVGNEELLQMVREGFSLYEAEARANKVWTGDQPLKKGNPDLYKAVKAEILGLGYGMGAKTYVTHAAGYGVDLDFEGAKKVVKAWRARNHRIPKMWGAFDADIIKAAMSPSRCLEIEMPTGELLRQFHVRATIKYRIDEETGERTAKRGYESFSTLGDFGRTSHQASLWGGTLTENVTQRMARDVIAEKVVAIEEAGLPVIFTSHDEVILEVDNDSSREEAKAEAIRLMTTAPEWAPGLPLAVEGDFAERYTK